MGEFIRYLLPVEQFMNANPWVRENGDYQHGELSINDTGDLTSWLTTDPPLDFDTYVRGTGQDGQGIYYPSISYWRYGALPPTAYNITVTYQAYLGCGMAGPLTRDLTWVAWDLNTLSWRSALFTVTNTMANYMLYEYDFGEMEPFTQSAWSAALLNACYFGLEATQDTFYATFCPVNWLLVSFDDGITPTTPRRGVGLLL